jgi:hypothetical protein
MKSPSSNSKTAVTLALTDPQKQVLEVALSMAKLLGRTDDSAVALERICADYMLDPVHLAEVRDLTREGNRRP